MDRSKVAGGMRVKTNPVLAKTTGTRIAEEYLNARRPNNDGEVLDAVPGYGGDLWWIRHQDGTKGVYMCAEFEYA